LRTLPEDYSTWIKIYCKLPDDVSDEERFDMATGDRHLDD
jgi:hypothetical protein